MGAQRGHEALLYRDESQLVAGVREWVGPALAAGHPVAMSLPGRSTEVLRPALGSAGRTIRFLDMEVVGRNPACIIPTLREWADEHAGTPLTFVGEPIWPGRRDREIAEAHRHEALLDVAFEGEPIRILCPYDARGLDPEVLAAAGHTHAVVSCDGVRRPGTHPGDPLAALELAGGPLPAAPERVPGMEVSEDFSLLRRFVRAHASAAGLADRRLEDLLLSAHEVAVNSTRHGGGDGVVRVWHDEETLTCEVTDRGTLADPLAGRRRPSSTGEHGRGLWIANQLCDLVELRGSGAGTTVRLHMRLP